MINDHPAATIRVLVLMPMLPGYEAVRATVAATVADAKLELVWLEDLLEDWEWLDWLYASARRLRSCRRRTPSDHHNGFCHVTN